jgi:hypothetical protein
MFPMVQEFNQAYVANTIGSINLRRLKNTADAMPLHVACIDIQIKAVVTPDAQDDEPGVNLFNILSRIVLRDVLGNELVNNRARELRLLIKAATGWIHDDPAAIVAAGDQDIFYAYLRIPFHGKEDGIAGYTEFSDCVQPVDRIRETEMELHFGGNPFTYATLDSAEVRVSFGTYPYRSVIQGADIRYSFLDHADAQVLEFPVRGRVMHTAIIGNDDESHADFTLVSVNEYGYLSNVLPRQLAQRWNEAVARENQHHIAPDDPQFLPIVYVDRRFSIQGAIAFTGGVLRVETTNTNADLNRLLQLEVHDTEDLTRKLMKRSGTVYQLAGKAKAMAAKKNLAGVNPGTAYRLARVLPYKLQR